MILYHGTSTARLPGILKKGLLPRGRGRPGNFRGNFASKAGLVYLTSWAAAWFAGMSSGKNDNAVILQVEVDEGGLVPDEDFMAYLFQETYGGKWKSHLKTVDPSRHPHLAHLSLKYLGNAATHGVPPERILGHRVVEDLGSLMAIGGDVSVSAAAHGILGPTYSAALQLLFSEGLEAAVSVGRSDFGLIRKASP